MAGKTRIVVQVDSSFEKALYVRGEGLSELSWDKGVALIHSKPDEWVFETDTAFTAGEFKVLVNDNTYELGDNHALYPGASIRINPKFPD